MRKTRPRRDYGDGGITYREKEDRYIGSFYLPDGTRKYVAGKVGGTKEELKKKLKEAIRQAEEGTLVATNKQKLADYMEYWLETHSLGLKESTNVLYSCHAHVHIIPLLGRFQLQKLSTVQVQQFINALVDENMASSTIHVIFTILNAALHHAVELKYVAVNPCKGVKLPRVEQQELQVLDETQIQMLLEAAQGHLLEGLVTLALATGMRRGELLALKWGDIDLERGCVAVRRTLVSMKGKGLVESSPKTKGSKRVISLAPFAVDALRQHRRRQVEERLQAEKWQEKDLVFCDQKGGYMPFKVLYRNFKQLLERAGLPDMHFHGLRHSFATLLLSMGEYPNIVQEILGHSTIAMTMGIYGHVLPGMQERSMSRLHSRLIPAKREAN